MNREIKFRAWDRENNKMRFKKDGTTFYDSEGSFPDEVIELTRRIYDWMQFTGLLDKNGKEIYEGDIINGAEVIFGECVFDSYYCVMGWTLKGDWVWDFSFTQQEADELEVVGNIYENKELLK